MQMNSKKKTAIAVLVTFILTTLLYTAALTVIPTFNTALGDVRAFLEGSDNPELDEKMREINRHIDDLYIYEADREKMNDMALTGYVAALGDAYTEYITKDNYKLMMETITGDYKGVGIEVFVDSDNLITVITAFDDGPAARAGIKAKDKLLEVNGKKISGDNYEEAVDMMKGTGKHAGSSDKLLFKVKRGEEELEFSVIRTEVAAHTVQTKMLKNNIGYIRLSAFDETTGMDFKIRLEQLLADGAKSLILDLRNNPGGTLTAVVSVADTILPKGKIITIKEKSGAETVYQSDKKEIDVPMCVLINGGSASASEVLAGAIKDHGKGILVGETSFGKGVVQTVLPLSDGSALKLTTAEYFTPSGKSIHKKGIIPDHVVKLETEKSVFALDESEDTQLQKAIEILSE